MYMIEHDKLSSDDPCIASSFKHYTALEVTEGVTKNRKSKDRKYNGQK
jgi:hypothetical protein